MKLLFLCTSLEPGRDGVGDYTRLLAGACTKQGHTCTLLALHDPFVSEEKSEATPEGLRLLRLPEKLTWAEKLPRGEQVVSELQPDWLSWQIVAYGFNPKGIMPEDAFPLARLGVGRKTHVMLHELWIGLSRGEPFKNRIWGWQQRRALEAFLERLNAVVLQTSNAAYQDALSQNNWHATLLPLFGNIPVSVGLPPTEASRQWTGAIFGTVHPQFGSAQCFDPLVQGAEIAQRKLRILGIGRLGDHGTRMFGQLARDYAGRMEVEVVGEKPPAEVSRLLASLDFGIGTHPWALAGKSGAIAAMLDHGLPVVVPRDDWVLRRNPRPIPSIDPLMIKLSEMPPELMAGRLSIRKAPASRLEQIAGMFLSNLQSASAQPATEL